jgi:hypothetical protein
MNSQFDMKSKYLLSLIIVPVCFILVSWGVTGHRAIGKIAENHLTPKAKAAVQDLLGTESMADVSTWADQIRMKEEFKYTTPWHYINLPLGLSYSEFKQKVENMTEDNVYSAVLKQEKLLTDKDTPREKKIEALKYIVHFVGDLHQPMHISRAEDQGGNKIQLNYDDKGTNLHSLWDTRLIEHQGLNYEQLAAKYGDVPAEQAKEWQHAPLITWMWESYQISSKLYAEVDQMKDRKIDSTYYAQHIPVIDVRIQQAGLRLAGMLNNIFKD